jgi:mannitol/fructose-specific phosphotransferase system IIA component (Ntr-type)
MKLSDIVSEDLILPDLRGTDRSSVLSEFVDAICASGKFNNSELLYQRLLERERQESTGIGNGVAIPHTKVESLQGVILAIAYSKEGVQFHAMDGKPTFFFFVVVSPTSASVLHLRTLAALSRLLRSQSFLTQLQQRPDKKELIALIKEQEETASVAS